MGWIKSINQGYTLAPNDCRILLKLILTSAQYTMCLEEWKDLATVQAMDNIANLEVGGLNELLGQGTYATPTAQANLVCMVLWQSSKISIKALKRVPESRRKDSSFASIRQGPQESYGTCIDRLQISH